MHTRTEIVKLHNIAETMRKMRADLKSGSKELDVEAQLALRDLNAIIRRDSKLLLPKLEHVARGESILKRNVSAAKAAAREMRFINDRAEGRV